MVKSRCGRGMDWCVLVLIGIFHSVSGADLLQFWKTGASCATLDNTRCTFPFTYKYNIFYGCTSWETDTTDGRYCVTNSTLSRCTDDCPDASPSFVSHPHIYGSNSKDEIILTCSAIGSPNPTIYWKSSKGGLRFFSSSTTVKPEVVTSFMILSNREENLDSYKCVAQSLTLTAESRHLRINSASFGDERTICQHPEPIPNSLLEGYKPIGYEVGDRVRYHCATGFMKLSQGEEDPWDAECQPDGSWSGPIDLHCSDTYSGGLTIAGWLAVTFGILLLAAVIATCYLLFRLRRLSRCKNAMNHFNI